MVNEKSETQKCTKASTDREWRQAQEGTGWTAHSFRFTSFTKESEQKEKAFWKKNKKDDMGIGRQWTPEEREANALAYHLWFQVVSPIPAFLS